MPRRGGQPSVVGSVMADVVVGYGAAIGRTGGTKMARDSKSVAGDILKRTIRLLTVITHNTSIMDPGKKKSRMF